MIKCAILDLDGTLVDTSSLEMLKTQRRWGELPNHLHQCTPYKEVVDVLNTARAAGIKVSIFTNSPSNYARSILKHFDLSVDYVVGFHDVQNHKPSSEGVKKILSHFGLKCNEAIYLGDTDDDKTAASNANVEFFAVDWGQVSKVENTQFGVSRLLECIWKRLDKNNLPNQRSKILQNGNHFYLGYYAEGAKAEIFSFKDNKQQSVDRWINKAVELSSSLPKIDCIVRALGHAETEASSTNLALPLDQLGSQLANSLGTIYRPDFVRKSRPLLKSFQCTKKEREQQVHGAYSYDSDMFLRSEEDKPTFLVIDDVLTSGATTQDINRALFDAFQGNERKDPGVRVYVFTLLKTLYRSQYKPESLEAQHNAQLIADLYTANTPVVIASANERSAIPPVQINLTSKTFSANYANTNHNFIFQNLRSFSIASESSSKPILNAVYVLKNMLQRGKPTIASRKLRKSVGLDQSQDILTHKSQALISQKPVNWRRLIRGNVKSGNNPAKHFFDELVPKYFGEYNFVKQLILPEVQIFDITQVYVDQFHNRQVDFYIPQVGLIIEIDGQQHEGAASDDKNRDAFTNTLGLKSIRFTTKEISTENQTFISKAESIIDHIRIIDRLEQKGVLHPPNGISLQDYRSAYNEGIDTSSPYVRLTAAIRFQILILELIECGDIRLGENKRILVINRDGINFATAALMDIKDFLGKQFTLMGQPDLELKIDIQEVSSLSRPRSDGDLIIDFSIFERFDDSFQTNHDVIYARTHYLDFYRQFAERDAITIENTMLVDYDFFEMSCSEPITYELDLSPESKQRDALKFFLSNLFLPYLDKVDFREGQLGIISSALSRKSTIGLLPTGAGKSICYQLSAILQPAISFVVCPIKSLMYDQKFDLDSIGFTRSNFITSELKPDQRAKVQNDFGQGKYFFVFISPERFQTLGFRSEMTAIGLDHTFAYAVIDEAHCLSEWGHDFRTSYLNLANTIERLAPDASYIGLTATASVNVLKDMQSEFSIPNNNVCTPLEYARKELSFHVVDDAGKKTEALLELVSEMEAKWNGKSSAAQDANAGIIFTPTVNGTKGCYELAGRISSTLDMDVRYFSGSAPKKGKLEKEGFDAYKKAVQRDFKANKYRLLTATKAFGMGVNKGNVAYTIHYGIPGSMEALYQEAGRAGRDKTLFSEAPANCYTLLTKEKNTGVLDKIWDASTSITNLKNNVEELSRESDLSTNLWFMTNNLDSIKDEFKLVDHIHNYLTQNNEKKAVTITAAEFQTNKSKFEKGVYRLSQLGIVSDWVIEDFFKGRLHIEFDCIGEVQLQKNLEYTIKKYDSGFVFDDIFSSDSEYYKILCKRLNKGTDNRSQFIFLVLLVWSYEHFVYNRRQSLKTVYEQCSELASGTIDGLEFKNRLEAYFKFNESSNLLQHLAENSADTSIWLDVFRSDEEITNRQEYEEKISTLKEQLSRFLESYKDNICLNYLSGVIRLMFDQFDDADGERRMASSLDRLMAHDRQDVENLIRETLELKRFFSIDAQCRFAKLIHEKFPETHILEMINRGFSDPYSYHQLLQPLALRLESIAKIYKRVQWKMI
jgi:ATP-dependent DNA helicase RecQ